MMEWSTTTTILDDLRNHQNAAAWRRFAERFRTPIVRFCRNSGLSDADSEDVAQEALAAFADAFREGRYDRQRGRLSSWLFGIAYNQILRQRQNAARQSARRTEPGSSFWDNLPGDDAAQNAWNQEWEQALIEQCLARVRQEVEPATMRAFEAVVQHNRTPAQAAAELGIPVKVVYNAKYAVLKRIRALMSELEEQDSHSG